MVSVDSRTKKIAMIKAAAARRRGFMASVFKKKDGYGTSVTRKK